MNLVALLAFIGTLNLSIEYANTATTTPDCKSWSWRTSRYMMIPKGYVHFNQPCTQMYFCGNDRQVIYLITLVTLHIDAIKVENISKRKLSITKNLLLLSKKIHIKKSFVYKVFLLNSLDIETYLYSKSKLIKSLGSKSVSNPGVLTLICNITIQPIQSM